jgi:hypothetical protein
VVLLTGCVAANTVALESQNRSLDGRQARLYFIRQSNAVAGLLTYPTVSIKVDGKPVSGLATGAYILSIVRRDRIRLMSPEVSTIQPASKPIFESKLADPTISKSDRSFE